jgi:hypothetical protein
MDNRILADKDSMKRIVLHIYPFESEAVNEKFLQLHRNSSDSKGDGPMSIPVSARQKMATQKEILMNDNFTIRADLDIYGRDITALRRKYTADDSKPFELALDS